MKKVKTITLLSNDGKVINKYTDITGDITNNLSRVSFELEGGEHVTIIGGIVVISEK